MSVGVITALIAGVVSLTVAGMSLVGASRAQRTTAQTQDRQRAAEHAAAEEQRKRDDAQARAVVEAEAYGRARESYELIVHDLQSQLERNQRTVEQVQTQFDLVMRRLATEQDVSNALRSQIRILRDQIDELQRENAQFRAVVERHQQVTSTLDTELRRVGLDASQP